MSDSAEYNIWPFTVALEWESWSWPELNLMEINYLQYKA